MKVPKHHFLTGLISLAAVGFGLLSIKQGGSVLFGDEAARIAAGKYVPFVLSFNFFAGFAYAICGAGLWANQRWAVWLAAVIAAACAVTFLALGAHIFAGGAYEARTVIAMLARTLLWIAITGFVWQAVIRRHL